MLFSQRVMLLKQKPRVVAFTCWSKEPSKDYVQWILTFSETQKAHSLAFPERRCPLANATVCPWHRSIDVYGSGFSLIGTQKLWLNGPKRCLCPGVAVHGMNVICWSRCNYVFNQQIFMFVWYQHELQGGSQAP